MSAVQVTAEHVGRVYVDRFTTDMAMVLGKGIVKTKPVEHVRRYVIVGVKPADPSYYRTCPNAGPRAEVALAVIKRDGSHNPARTTTAWLPTTGNDATVEIEPEEPST